MINLEMRLPHIGARGEAMSFMPPPPTREEELAAARSEAAAKARAEVESESERKLELLRAEHAEALEAARRNWCAGEGEQFATAFAADLQQAIGRINEAMTEALVPFMGSLLREAAVRGLEAKIADALASDLAAQIRLAGPRELAARVAAGLAARGFKDVAVQAEQPELQAECGELLIRTRMAAWLQALREASHG